MTEIPTGGGLDHIREAVAARQSVMVIMARDSGLAVDTLASFAEGRANIPANNLDRVVKWVWNGHIRYNAEADALQSVEQPEPRSIGVLPKLEMTLPKYTPGPPQLGGPQPVDPAPVKKSKRAGWISWG